MSAEPIGNRRKVEKLAGGGFVYSLLDEGIRIEARYLRRDRGLLHAEVDVQCNWAGVHDYKGSLSCADLNLSSQSSRKSLAKHCEERSRTKSEDYFDWINVIDAACLEIIRADREGDPVIVLDDAEDLQVRDFDVLGLKVPADAASIVIAHGDSMKSYVALLVLGTLAKQGHPVLYLDWEWTADRHKARKRRLFGPQRIEHLHYLRCHAPLVVEAERIRRFCDQQKIEFMAVDSVGVACDGKLTDDDVAIRFHRALRDLPPALCAAHVPKSSIGPDAKGDAVGPFGSVFFSNLCRMSWLVKKQPGADPNVATVGLFPQKQNDGERVRPVGLEFTFDGERIDVQPVDVAGVDGLSKELPLAGRMVAALKVGPKTLAELAKELDAKPDTVRVTANRAPNMFTKVLNAPDGVHRLALVENFAARSAVA